MIFLPEQIEWIFDKSPHTGVAKTAIVHPVYWTHEVTLTYDIGAPFTRNVGELYKYPSGTTIISVSNNDRMKWAIRREYSVCPGVTKKSVGRIVLSEIVFVASAGDITYQQSRKCGFSFKSDLLEHLNYSGDSRFWLLCWDKAYKL